MRTRNLLATVVAGTLLAGVTGVLAAPAQANRAPSAATAGSVVAWADPEQPLGVAAAATPEDLTAPVSDVATSMGATGVVTTDGHLRVWGIGTEVDEAPTDVTDAVAVALNASHGAVLRADGKITAWGETAAIADVPADLRAKAIAVGSGGTGYAVRTDGTLTTWGAVLVSPLPAWVGELTDLVDVSVGLQGQGLALRADGTVFAWGADPDPEAPFNNVPDDLDGKKVTDIATGGLSDGIVLEDGTIRVWGVAPVANEPDFAGKKVVSLSIGAGFMPTAGAVTEDGVVHTWGGDPEGGINNHPASLAGEPVAAIGMGMFHAAVIVTAFRDLTKPAISGTAKVGQTLTATPATFNLTPDAPATGQWYADAAPIAGQTGTTLALAQAQVGKKISYRSTATRSGTTVSSVSNELGPVAAVVVTPPVTKAKSKVTATARATGKTKKLAKKVTITVTVKTAKGVSPAGKVKVTLKGKTKKTVTVKVNAKGKATVTVKKVKRGKYQAQLTYAGNAKVASSKKTIKFKV